MTHIVILGTCDTKLHELLYLRQQILSSGATQVTLVDVGRSPTSHQHITISQTTLLELHSPRPNNENEAGKLNADLQIMDRGEVIEFMTSCATSYLSTLYKTSLQNSDHNTNNGLSSFHGVISAGGTGGTSLASSAMRSALPLGFPKLIVSTAASGDTGPIVGESDITLMYSVVDIAGTNSFLQRILSNAAGGIVGMAKAYAPSKISSSPSSSDEKEEGGKEKKRKWRVGLTMFGVTTPCVDVIRNHLETHYPIECFVFHCTGHGGKAMERLISQGELDAVIDLTTTEIADHIVGGVMSAGENRLEEGLKKGIPYVISLGATDMVNFGPPNTLPEKHHQRTIFNHNPTVTLMRTSPTETHQIGTFILSKIQSHTKNKSLVKIIIPQGGVSMLSIPGGPFYDPRADEVMFEILREGGREFGVEVVVDEREVNDEGFARMLAGRLVGLMGLD